MWKLTKIRSTKIRKLKYANNTPKNVLHEVYDTPNPFWNANKKFLFYILRFVIE